MKRVGILYHPRLERARSLAAEVREALSSQGVSLWHCPTSDDEKARPQVADSDLIISIGGDGTILHAVRIVSPIPIPIVGINMGRLGFVTELKGNGVLSDLSRLLHGDGWIDERAMLEARIGDKSYHALNDVVIRSVAVRLANIETRIDDVVLTTYRADGVIAATATGSTSYSLAAGGPILHPQSQEIILQPVCCHLGLSHALVLPGRSTISFSVEDGDRTVLSMDGQVELPLSDGHEVTVKLSPHKARFLRIQPPDYFYSSLWQRLGGQHERRQGTDD